MGKTHACTSRSCILPICLALLGMLSACGQKSSTSAQAMPTTQTVDTTAPAEPHADTSEDASATPDSASLSTDILLPPAQPSLSIQATAGNLHFSWQAIQDQRHVRLYHHDTLTGGEVLVYHSDDARLNQVTLSNHSPGTAWHRVHYRLELCTADDCLSSARHPLSGMAIDTRQWLTPAVHVRDERYGEQLALDRDATIAVLALPVEGALEIRSLMRDSWTLLQRVRLEELDLSDQRTMRLSISDSGDVIALLMIDEDRSVPAEIRVLQRLGEAWQQSASWTVPDIPSGTATTSDADVSADSGRDSDALAQDSIRLSAQGDALLLQFGQRLHVVRMDSGGWTDWQSLPLDDSSTAENASSPMTLKASLASEVFDRVLILAEQDEQLYLHSVQWQAASKRWEFHRGESVQGFDPQRQLFLHGNHTDELLMIAGWEASAATQRHPVMQRYRLTSAEASTGTVIMDYLDSVRAAPAPLSAARLIFSADDSLTLAVLGWHLPEQPAGNELADALFNSWQYHANERLWLTALELPEAIPTLAKQAFAAPPLLAADGSTLMLAIDAPDIPFANAGAVMVVR